MRPKCDVRWLCFHFKRMLITGLCHNPSLFYSQRKTTVDHFYKILMHLKMRRRKNATIRNVLTALLIIEIRNLGVTVCRNSSIEQGRENNSGGSESLPFTDYVDQSSCLIQWTRQYRGIN